jgi:hypothetical protein
MVFVYKLLFKTKNFKERGRKTEFNDRPLRAPAGTV